MKAIEKEVKFYTTVPGCDKCGTEMLVNKAYIKVKEEIPKKFIGITYGTQTNWHTKNEYVCPNCGHTETTDKWEENIFSKIVE